MNYCAPCSMILPFRILKMCRSQYGNWMQNLMECYQVIKCQYFKPTKVFNYHFNQLKGLSNCVPQETSFYESFILGYEPKEKKFGQINLRNICFLLSHHGSSQSYNVVLQRMRLHRGQERTGFLKRFSCGMGHNHLSWNTVYNRGHSKLLGSRRYVGRDQLSFYPRLLPIFDTVRTRARELRHCPDPFPCPYLN